LEDIVDGFKDDGVGVAIERCCELAGKVCVAARVVYVLAYENTL
jgi:hypothetical protein